VRPGILTQNGGTGCALRESHSEEALVAWVDILGYRQILSVPVVESNWTGKVKPEGVFTCLGRLPAGNPLGKDDQVLAVVRWIRLEDDDRRHTAARPSNASQEPAADDPRWVGIRQPHPASVAL
jgi:hypothetical protein